MFTYPCFIRKNTPELREKLEKIGYNEFVFNRDEFEDDDVLEAIELDGNIPVYLYASYKNLINICQIYACDNEELFLSLAALRDDTDRYQWFVSDEGTFRYCLDEIFDVGMANYINYYPTHWHKATPEELIEHFKN